MSGPESRDQESRLPPGARRGIVIAATTMVAIVVVFFLFVFVFPTQTFIEQRRELSREEARLELLRAENDKLEARAEQLRTEAEIERIAREKFDMVRPDEDAYAILPPTSTAPGP